MIIIIYYYKKQFLGYYFQNSSLEIEDFSDKF